MTNTNFQAQGCDRGRRTLRVRVTIEVQEELFDEFLTHRIVEALEVLLDQPEFVDGAGALRHVHDLPLADGRIAVVTTEAVNFHGDVEIKRTARDCLKRKGG